ncbi:MAG TPA: hypothetical protein VGP19_05120 [Candidatus Acidoferrales bacterium]|nr:hypothetical protein [Candidatus Acidoferrales bacterium]
MLLLLFVFLVFSRPADAQRQASRSPHGALTIPCENCHTNTGWTPIRAIPEFNHDTTRYPLRGMHEKVSCTGCHAKPTFTDVGSKCADCHADIHRAQFGTNCAQCHTVLGWQVSVQSIQQHFNRFPLLGAHAVVECEQCHTNAAVGNYVGLSTLCSSCHMADWQQTTNPVHPSAGAAFAAANCTTCHSFDNWLNAKFDHSSTGFLLTSGHANLACALCHINNNYNLTVTPTDCGNSGCHLTTWQSTTNPAHPSAGSAFAAANCSTCHTTVSWTTATFDHSTTGFPLTSGHANVACNLCHINNNYNLTIAPTDCGNSQCHLTTWQQTNNPVHSTSGPAFGAANCSTCHTPAGWTAAAFDHSITGFTLTGTHMSPTPTPCASCHANNNYMLDSADCYGCHQASFQSTTSIGGSVPNHVTAGFPTTASACATCHSITTWAAGVFNHAATGFPLTNGHANVACNLCHINGNYSLNIAATDCGNSQCHLTTWQQTNNPAHSTAGSAFAAANCSTCHTTTGWTAAAFDHSITGFTLIGTHMSPTPTPCASCHVNNNYTLNSADCYGCHQAVYQSTATIGGSVPNHVTAGFPTTAAQCASCHPISTWSAGVFNHASTGFPLTNSHATVACSLCHINGSYSLSIAPTDCGNSGCHLNTNDGGGWQGTNAPPHSAAGPLFAVANCATCHTTVSFLTATFDHSTTGFALTGMHISPTPTPCASCHVGNNYALNSTACYGCHATDWQSTATLGGAVPNHSTAGFPTDCSICHSTTNWTTSTFNHSTTTFPLTGAHTTVACALCHVNGNYSGTLPTNCYGCHASDYQSTTTLGGAVPNHVTLGYPTTCTSCHTTTSWLGATFNHSTTGFPLTGAHITVACNLCHTTSATPPTDCYSCHTAQWQSTTTLGGSVPDHTGTGFPAPSTCSSCHNTTAWTGATFTHSWWRIPHNGATCANCHQTPGLPTSYVTFSCINGCHTPESSWQQKSGRHNAGNYGPMTCTASGCHPNG